MMNKDNIPGKMQNEMDNCHEETLGKWSMVNV